MVVLSDSGKPVTVIRALDDDDVIAARAQRLPHSAGSSSRLPPAADASRSTSASRYQGRSKAGGGVEGSEPPSTPSSDQDHSWDWRKSGEIFGGKRGCGVRDRVVVPKYYYGIWVLERHLSRTKLIARSTIDMPWRNFLSSEFKKSPSKRPYFCRYLNFLKAQWSKEAPYQKPNYPFIHFDRTSTCDRQTDRQTRTQSYS